MLTNSLIEKRIINMFLEIDYPWKHTLIGQLHDATHRIELFDTACFIVFSVDSLCSAITNVPRVPLSIIIEFGCSDTTAEVLFDSNCISFCNVNPSPIECNLHIVDGYLKEIEVYTLDGTQLKLDGICEGKRRYLFH